MYYARHDTVVLVQFLAVVSTVAATSVSAGNIVPSRVQVDVIEGTK